MAYGIDTLFSMTYRKVEVKRDPQVTTMIKYAWYVFESESLKQAQIFLQFITTYMYAPIGIMHMINGLILDRVTFDTFT